jgi:hypothetical protein
MISLFGQIIELINFSSFPRFCLFGGCLLSSLSKFKYAKIYSQPLVQSKAMLSISNVFLFGLFKSSRSKKRFFGFHISALALKSDSQSQKKQSQSK